MADTDNNPGNVRWWQTLTPAQRATWRANVSKGTSAGQTKWHANRTAEQRQQTHLRLTDAAACRTFLPRKPGAPLQKGQTLSNTPSPALRSLRQVQSASIRRIMKEVVVAEPETIRQALIEGLQAPPPRSFPYLALAAAYLDGKPTTDGVDSKGLDLSSMSMAELAERAEQLGAQLRGQTPHAALPVIDVTPQSEDK